MRSRGGVRNPRDAGVWDGPGAAHPLRPKDMAPQPFSDLYMGPRSRLPIRGGGGSDAAARDFGLAARLIMGMARCSSFRTIW